MFGPELQRPSRPGRRKKRRATERRGHGNEGASVNPPVLAGVSITECLGAEGRTEIAFLWGKPHAPGVLRGNLNGEIVVNEASFVRKCIGTDSSQDDLWGKLICTNFKISFITQDPSPRQKFHYVNRLLGEHDIPLACVEQVVTVNDAKGKRKVLGSNQKLKFSPTELIVYCKDFRVVRFRFDEAGPESAKKVCLAIAHYSQPADPQLLFGFEYVGKRYHASGDQVNGADQGAACRRPSLTAPATGTERSSARGRRSGGCAPSTKATPSLPVFRSTLWFRCPWPTRT
ncbi:hypothetical protein ANANG_G00104830 [Anguilla anguilla]|uniref:Myotubularin phosphatase domain-containing protein n=1 Tax=Anguilla anguilla TaxID=7936 RepID=A0A9D3MJR0_ANGAN|nr:hypothetical protein ANANG_G00104830 [Anguilla anguilla]